MKNMSCAELRIVGNKADYSDEQVRTLAVHAADIWESAKFYEPTAEGLRESLRDSVLSAGTTRRMGYKRKSWGMTPEQFTERVRGIGDGSVAIVFGNERTGLTDEELECCSVAINIPSNDDFPSLNLSHAVQIMTYALFRAFDGHKRGYDAVTKDRLAQTIASISESIDHVGLFQLGGKRDNELFLEAIFARAGLSESEARRVEKLFRKLAWVRTGSSQVE